MKAMYPDLRVDLRVEVFKVNRRSQLPRPRQQPVQQRQRQQRRTAEEDPIITHGAVRELVEADNSRLSPQIIIIVRQQHRQQKQKQLELRA